MEGRKGVVCVWGGVKLLRIGYSLYRYQCETPWHLLQCDNLTSHHLNLHQYLTSYPFYKLKLNLCHVCIICVVDMYYVCGVSRCIIHVTHTCNTYMFRKHVIHVSYTFFTPKHHKCTCMAYLIMYHLIPLYTLKWKACKIDELPNCPHIDLIL